MSYCTMVDLNQGCQCDTQNRFGFWCSKDIFQKSLGSNTKSERVLLKSGLGLEVVNIDFIILRIIFSEY